MEKEFLEALAGLFGKKAEEAGFYSQPEKEGDEPQLKPSAELVKSIGAIYKDRLDDRYKAAQRKTAQQYESWVKAQGFDGEGQGTDLLSAYVDHVKSKTAEEAAKQAGQGEGKLTPEAVKGHELYQGMVTKLENLQATITEKDSLIESEKNKSKRFITSTVLRQQANKILKEAKWAVQPEDWEVRLNMLLKDFNPDKIKVDGIGGNDPKVTILDDHGDPLTDELHRPVDFKTQILGTGKHLGGFHAADPGKGSPPPSGNNGNTGAGSGFKVPENIGSMDAKTFTALIRETKDPAHKQKLREARIAHLDSK